jgi:Tfp pilus assembly protein PilF
MTSPPSVSFLTWKNSYQQAWVSVKRYKQAIAVLNHREIPRSPALVRGILCSRNNAYIASRRIPKIWLAEIVCNLSFTSLDFLSWLIGELPRPLFRIGKSIFDWSGIGHYRIPKSLRKWLSGLQQVRWLIPVCQLVHSIRLIKTLKDLDSALYSHVDELNTFATQIPPELWQRLQFPPERDLFGLLNPPKPLPWRDRLDSVWEFFSIALLSASFAILVDISARLFSTGANTQGIQAIIVPSLLTLLAGGGLTRTGREFLGRIFDNLGAPRYWRDEFIFASILMLFLVISLIWMNLPSLAKTQVQQAHQALCISQKQTKDCIPQLSKAESGYGLAIKLDPENTEAHYGLGRVYEALQLNEQAIAEYQITVKGELQGISYEAYDRLARLFILQGKKDDAYIKAISLSKDGLNRLLNSNSKEQQPLTPEALKDIKYNLKKNHAWALLVGQENLNETKKLLEETVDLDPYKAPAYCLLAQIKEALHDPSAAESDWSSCQAFARSGDLDEERWQNLSRERLTQIKYEELIKQGKRLLEQNQLKQAEQVLRKAIGLLKGKSPAYCLLAQTEETLNQFARAKTHWELCLEYSRQNEQDREKWLNLAREHLKEN